MSATAGAAVVAALLGLLGLSLVTSRPKLASSESEATDFRLIGLILLFLAARFFFHLLTA